MTFPHESVPDGAVFAPHHFTYGALAALFVAATIWDDYPEWEPVGVCGGLSVALFGFLNVWRWYPVTGAALALVGTVAALASTARPRWREFRRRRCAVGLMCLVALDDLVNHAFGVPTPLDLLWVNYIYPYMM
jgi:hypothetical protein